MRRTKTITLSELEPSVEEAALREAYLQQKARRIIRNVPAVYQVNGNKIEMQYIQGTPLSSINLTKQEKQNIKAKVKDQVIKGLLANNDVDVPQALIAGEVDVLRKQALQRFGNNVDPKQLPELPASLFEEQAKDRVKVGLLLGEVIKTSELKVDDKKVQALIETVASAYEDPQEVVQYYNSNKELLQSMRNVALEEQAIEVILASAKVTEQKAAFDEIMNPQAAN